MIHDTTLYLHCILHDETDNAMNIYLTLFVNCTPVLITRGLSGCMGIQGCLSTTKALQDRVDQVSHKIFSKIQKHMVKII